MQRNNPAPVYDPNEVDTGIYRGGSKDFYDKNPGQKIGPPSLYSDPNMGGGAKGGRQGPPQGGRMIRGPNGNMYNPNELPSNLRMETGGDPRKSPNGRAVFADDYVLKPSDQGYMSNDLPRPMLTNIAPQFDRRGRQEPPEIRENIENSDNLRARQARNITAQPVREIVGNMRQGPGSGDGSDFRTMMPLQQTSEVAQPLMNEADMPPLRHVNMSTNQPPQQALQAGEQARQQSAFLGLNAQQAEDAARQASGQFMSQMQQQVPQGIASLSNMRYGDSQRQQAFGNEQQRLLNQMNRFDGRFRGR
tara:strand:- start:77 stop:991 length:915 start_codon:yes stop_codon:yes gene_type:complete